METWCRSSPYPRLPWPHDRDIVGNKVRSKSNECTDWYPLRMRYTEEHYGGVPIATYQLFPPGLTFSKQATFKFSGPGRYRLNIPATDFLHMLLKPPSPAPPSGFIR